MCGTFRAIKFEIPITLIEIVILVKFLKTTGDIGSISLTNTDVNSFVATLDLEKLNDVESDRFS